MAWVERLDEARADAPDMPRYRARKDRKRWCRGKPGVGHVPVVAMAELWRYWQTRDGTERSCTWYPARYGRADGKWDYSCWHQERCATCGKILKARLGRDCPTFTPR
jgi:hypothetical protein